MYVMRTLRDFFHIGSVECVTFQLPLSHDSVGGVIELIGEGEEDVDGWRRMIMGVALNVGSVMMSVGSSVFL